MLNDLRLALRSLSKTPGVVLLIVFCLALGVGANTTIFSLTNAVFVRPLPVRDAHQLVRIYPRQDARGFGSSSYAELTALNAQSAVFAGVAAYRDANTSFGQGEETTIEKAMLVSGSFFSLIGLRPAVGRFFTHDDDVPGAGAVTVLSHRFWQSRFGGDPAVIGQTVAINGQPYRVLGVTPPEYMGLEPEGESDLWIPLSMHNHVLGRNDGRLQPGFTWLTLVGRLAPNVDREHAAAVVNATAPEMAKLRGSDPATFSYAVLPGGTLASTEASDEIHVVFILLNAVVALVLLIACANVANVLLARALNRRREIAIRLSLGASRWRLVRQHLVESVVLAMLGGVAGFVAALWGADLLRQLNLPVGIDPSPDLRVLLYAFAIALLTGFVFGVAPALQASRTSVVDAIKQGSKLGTRLRSRLRSSLVVVQITMSVLVLVVAGLLLRTLHELRRAPTGADTAGMIAAELNLSSIGADTVQGRLVFDQVLERVSALPGVQAATLSTMVPSGSRHWVMAVRLPEHAEYNTRDASTNYNIVGPGYFTALGMPLLRGRNLDDARADVVVINEAFAERYFPAQNPLGKHIRTDEREWEIVGVTRDVRFQSAGLPAQPTMFMSYHQQYSELLVLQIRAVTGLAALVPAIRRELHTVRPGLAATFRTFEQIRRDSETVSRMVATLLSIFGSLALLLATVGLYGVTAFLVSQRTYEIGVRMALGARASGVLALFTRNGLRLAGIGLLIGVVLAAAAGQLLSAVLYGVSPFDPLAIGVVTLLMLTMAALASVIPARRAARVDPIIALRAE
jgi:predicted permease